MSGAITWRFEMLLHGGTEWLPYNGELLGEDDIWLEHAGTHTLDDYDGDPVEFAKEELDNALSELADDGARLGMARARIVIWRAISAEGDPVVVVQASDEQLATGRLRRVAVDVHIAVRKLEEARKRLRNQVIASGAIDRLGRNHIAREVDGAWARRLVLQYLAGHDLVRTVQRALPRDWSDLPPYPAEEYVPDEEHLGPYWCGPVRMELDANGQVRLSLADVDGPPYHHLEQDPSDEDIARYNRGVALRAHTNADIVLPLLHRAGIHLRTADNTEARTTDLIETCWRGGHLVVTKPDARAAVVHRPATAAEVSKPPGVTS